MRQGRACTVRTSIGSAKRTGRHALGPTLWSLSDPRIGPQWAQTPGEELVLEEVGKV